VDDIEALHWHDAHYDYVEEMRRLEKDRLVVSAVIVCDGKLLLVRRSTHDSYPGMWEFPGGGVDEEENDFEHIVVALRREVLEETGIELPEIPSGEVLAHPTRTALRVILRFDLVSISNVVLSEEHDDFRLLDLEEAKSTRVGDDIIYDTMRVENQNVMKAVFSNNMDTNL